MSVTRNDSTQGVWSKLLLLSVTLPLLSGNAFAQNPLMPGLHTQKEEKQLTPEEQERQKRLDADHKAATKKIPDQGVTDPWGGVRPTPTVKRQFKSESTSPYHRDSFNKQTPQ
ncbi:MAG: hypothetical protein WAK55_05350 [Xanthobacteraceae bacterium]